MTRVSFDNYLEIQKLKSQRERRGILTCAEITIMKINGRTQGLPLRYIIDRDGI